MGAKGEWFEVTQIITVQIWVREDDLPKMDADHHDHRRYLTSRVKDTPSTGLFHVKRM